MYYVTLRTFIHQLMDICIASTFDSVDNTAIVTSLYCNVHIQFTFILLGIKEESELLSHMAALYLTF